jgi:putative endonuclease
VKSKPWVYNPRYMNTKETGALGESIASRFLAQKGFLILGMNYRKPWGEIDIIAERAGIVRFVEVKAVTRERIEIKGSVSREMEEYRPEEQVHPQKLKKICRTAETYMIETHDQREFQIDVVAIFLNPSKKQAVCRLYENVL